MTINNHITASCLINQAGVYKNGQPVFVNASKESAGDFFVAIYKSLNIDYARFYKMDNLSKLGWLASEVLLKDSFSPANYTGEEVGLVLSNANASLDTDLKYMKTTQEMASPSVFVYTLPNIMTGEICIRNHFKGETAFFVSEQFDPALIASYVSLLLDKNILRSCICGWVDLLGNDFAAMLYLVEKREAGMEFTKENMNKIFK